MDHIGLIIRSTNNDVFKTLLIITKYEYTCIEQLLTLQNDNI